MAPRSAAPARTPLMAGNWKMNLNHLEAVALLQKLAFTLTEAELRAVEVAILVPFTSLRGVQTLVDGDRLLIRYGAQDLSPHADGAYTGDISAAMLAKLGCDYVLVGHSERRAHHGESDEVVNAKLLAALRAGIRPILCVGEGLETRESGEHTVFCRTQLDRGLVGVPAEQAEQLVIAYEPVWAIGTGKTATPEHAQEVCGALRARLAERFSPEVAGAVRVLYGGSVSPGNVADLLAEPDVDGALVGGASLDADSFARIVRYTG